MQNAHETSKTIETEAIDWAIAWAVAQAVDQSITFA